ncbi:MAG: metallophosphoesterase [Bdellovibrionota bacterium]
MSLRLLRIFVVLSFFIGYTAFALARLWPRYSIWALPTTFLLFAVMLGSQLIYRAVPSVFDAFWYRVVAWISNLLIGLWGTFLMISIPVVVVNIFVGQFLSRGLILSIFGLALSFTVLGFLETLRGPRIKEIRLPVEGLGSGLEGLTVVQLSDLHIGPTLRDDFLRNVVEKTNALSPDLVVITGDLGDARPAAIEKYLIPLRELRSKYGVFYVTGNHEYYWDAKGIVAAAARTGLIPLINEGRFIDVGGLKLLVAGVTDPMGAVLSVDHHPDTAKALRDSAAADFTILLAHRPDVCLEAESLGADLQFSGHTHAGQFFPFSLFVPLAHTYYRGLNRHGRMWVYVNPGTGYWGPPNRFAVPAEITLLKLEKA